MPITGAAVISGGPCGLAGARPCIHRQYHSLHLVSVFCVALPSLSVFELLLVVILVSSISIISTFWGELPGQLWQIASG